MTKYPVPDLTELKQAVSELTEAECINMAEKFQIPLTTVYKWVTGVARPHPWLREAIIEFCEQCKK